MQADPGREAWVRLVFNGKMPYYEGCVILAGLSRSAVCPRLDPHKKREEALTKDGKASWKS
jgi:hypothetical protein